VNNVFLKARLQKGLNVGCNLDKPLLETINYTSSIILFNVKTETSRWIIYNVVVCFAVYWLSNLILWYPWSVNETSGQILMLTINPLLWGFASYSCIIRYPKQNLINGVLLNSLIFVIEAIASDLIFFVVIRNAADKLMHITTLYAWVFVMFLPLIIYLLFRKLIIRNKKQLAISNFWKPLYIAVISFAIITVILIFNFRLG
jgi:hypothetical protein